MNNNNDDGHDRKFYMDCIVVSLCSSGIVLLMLLFGNRIPIWLQIGIILWVLTLMMCFCTGFTDVRTDSYGIKTWSKLLRKLSKGVFDVEVNELIGQMLSVLSREPLMQDKDTDVFVKEKYKQICQRLIYNTGVAEKFLRNYDFVLKPCSDVFTKLLAENDLMLRKLNELIEAMVNADMSVSDVDLSDIDMYLSDLQSSVDDE